MRMIRKGFAALAVALVLTLLYAGGSAENAFEISRVGKINPYADNIFRITAAEAGDVTVRIHDNICVYRELREHVEAGVTDIHWDGCSYNEERLYSKTYTVTALFETDAGKTHSISFQTPVDYALQHLLYALSSAETASLDDLGAWFLEYRTVTDGTVIVELIPDGQQIPSCTWSLQAPGGRLMRKDLTEIAQRNIPEPGKYTVNVYEKSRADEVTSFPLEILNQKPEKTAVTVTGEIMPDRTMSDEEIWELMMKPSVVVDIDFFKHQEVYTEKDENSPSLGTLHGQTQGLKIIRIEDGWALAGAWNHEDAEYVEGWVPLSNLKVESPRGEYGLLIDKRKQTMSVYRNGKVIDTLLVSTGRAAKNRLYQETSAGCFLTGYHRVNFSTNGKKYDYVFQYDGGNLLHQTPYNWGQQKKDFTLGRGYLGAKASHACIRIQPEPGEGGVNAYWLYTHIPYHTRVIILDDPEERTATSAKLRRSANALADTESLRTTDNLPAGTEDTVVITFAGCLIPGGERSFNTRKESFSSFIQENGADMIFNRLKPVFSGDDLTCVNLPVPLQGTGENPPSGKAYGAKDTEQILKDVSVELVQLTNEKLYAEDSLIRQTANAVRPYAMTLERGQTVTTTLKGHLFGFAGCSEEEYLKDVKLIDRLIGELREKKCERIVFLADWGEEKATEHSIVQEAMAHRAVRAGADLVVGQQQGVIQGIDLMEGVTVVYSPGNLIDGSRSTIPGKNNQAILVRTAFRFGQKDSQTEVTVIPICPYGSEQKGTNEYRPALEMTETVFAKIVQSLFNDTTDTVMGRITFLKKIQSN